MQTTLHQNQTKIKKNVEKSSFQRDTLKLIKISKLPSQKSRESILSFLYPVRLNLEISMYWALCKYAQKKRDHTLDLIKGHLTT